MSENEAAVRSAPSDVAEELVNSESVEWLYHRARAQIAAKMLAKDPDNLTVREWNRGDADFWHVVRTEFEASDQAWTLPQIHGFLGHKNQTALLATTPLRVRQDDIEQLAHSIWEVRGTRPNGSLTDWKDAEYQLRSRQHEYAVGSALIEYRWEAKERKVLRAWRLSELPELESAGVRKRILKNMTSTRHGCTEIQTVHGRDDEEATDWFLNNGFRIAAMHPDFYGPREDALEMRKRIHRRETRP